jgi:hypothetical protein
MLCSLTPVCIENDNGEAKGGELKRVETVPKSILRQPTLNELQTASGKCTYI